MLKAGELPGLSNGAEMLVRKVTEEPSGEEERYLGKFGSYLGEELVRTYVPISVRPWVMDQILKEMVHLGGNVTLFMLQRYYWWIGIKYGVNVLTRR